MSVASLRWHQFWILLVAGILATPIFSKVHFKNSPIQWEATVNKDFSIDLNTLVEGQDPGPLQWSTPGGKPNWLTLDVAGGRLLGTPKASDAGQDNFRLAVQQGDNGDIAQIEMRVIALPKWTQNPVDLGFAWEDKPFEFDLNTVVTAPNGVTLSFSAKGLPNWLSLSMDGKLTGTPRRPHVGKYAGIVFTANGKGGSASASAYGEVIKTVHPPKWVKDQITLAPIKEDAPYSNDLSQYVDNFENAELSYDLVSSSPWAKVSTNGTLFGTPGSTGVGQNSLYVHFKTEIDGKTYEDTAEFLIFVEHVNHPPQWKSDLIQLPSAFTSMAYQQTLADSAWDPDPNDTLSYSIQSGPKWLRVNPNGTLTGTPDKKTVGLNTWIIRVTDNEGADAESQLEINVIKTNEPPVWLSNPSILPDAKEDFTYTRDLSQLAMDPDGDALTFTLLTGPTWAYISPTGTTISGVPRADAVGLNKFEVRVTDGIAGHAAVAELIIHVQHTNHPPSWVLQPVVFQVNEESPLNEDLTRFTKDPDEEDTLTYTLLSGPEWISLSMDGKRFSGTPQMQHEGENRFKIRIQDDEGAFKDGWVIVNVLPINHKPTWSGNPIQLPDAKEKEAYQTQISSFASDPDPEDSLTFKKISGPDWIHISADGSLSGTPARTDLGNNRVAVRVQDLSNETAQTHFDIEVLFVNTPPRWRVSQLPLEPSYEDLNYEFDISKFATDDDGDPLTFRKKDGVGPDWMFVAPSGVLQGIPTKNDIGKFTTILIVSDGKATAEIAAIGEVIHRNHAPEVQWDNLYFVIKEDEAFNLSLNHPDYVSDSDGDTLLFSLSNAPDWISLDTNGELEANPQFEDIGEHEFAMTVSDGEAIEQGKLIIEVLRNASPPVWSQNPISLQARTNELFSLDLNVYAHDEDGLKLTYQKVSGPQWLTLAANGKLSATPRDTDLGLNTLVVEARNDKLGTEATFEITVVLGTFVDKIETDAPVEGAQVENIWLVDSSQFSYSIDRALKSCIHHYYETINRTEVQHTGIFLSTDADHFDGKPILGQDNALFLEGEDSNVITDFINRVTSAYSYNCFNTPIWSLFRYFERAAESDYFQKDFFKPSVPIETLIVTQQRDHFKHHTSHTPHSSFQAKEFAEHFKNFAQNNGQTLQISAITPKTPYLETTQPQVAAKRDSYQTLIQETGGKFYPYAVNYTDMGRLLIDYASHVILIARATAKKEILLTHAPMETQTMVVRLGEEALTKDLHWSYQSGPNSVRLHWEKIPVMMILPGTEISIEYRIS